MPIKEVFMTMIPICITRTADGREKRKYGRARNSRNVAPLFLALFNMLFSLSCENPIITEWYREEKNEEPKILSGECDILSYEFFLDEPIDTAGTIQTWEIVGSRAGDGSEDDPIFITINYPFEKYRGIAGRRWGGGLNLQDSSPTNFPINENEIKIVHTGVKIRSMDTWCQTENSGEFTRDYTVTAENGTEKSYRVIASEGPDPFLCFTVTFDANEGYFIGFVPSVKQTRLIPKDESIKPENMPSSQTRPGYAFSGSWNTEQDGSGSLLSGGTVVTEDITVYAMWQDQFTVTFDANGGNFSGESTTQTRMVNISNTGVGNGNMPSPSYPGHNFLGWNTEQDSGVPSFSGNTAVTGDITVYAQWEFIPLWTVTFYADVADINNDGSVKEKRENVPNGTTVTAPDPTEYQDNLTFVEWWYTTGNGDTSATFNSGSTRVYSDIKVYATWRCTVTFMANGGIFSNGSTTPQTRTALINGTVGNTPSPSRTGYEFLGWNTKSDGEGTDFTANTEVSENIEVHAKWQERNKLTVIFDADEGTITINGEETYTITDILYDSTVTLPTAVKGGYHFGGWYPATNGVGLQFTASTRVTADRTVFAKWQYEVTFDANGGSIDDIPTKTQLVDIDGIVGANYMPSATQAGKRFFGWYTDQAAYDDTTAFDEFTPVTRDITVYARWIDAGVL
jgi:uncharacterized repeat protein (TIGR02543 family)